MKIAFNYVNIVALGNFNPAIVTPDFLNKDCELKLGEPTDQSPSIIPVHRHIKFKNRIFDVDMDALKISETGIEDINKATITDFFSVFYERLPYTPLRAVGVNINCNLTITEILIDKLSKPQTYLKFLNAKEIETTEKSRQTITDKIWLGSNYRVDNVRGLTRLINTTRKKDIINLNYNYEAGNLKKDKERLKLLLNEYKQFCNEFLSFIKFLGE
jgi:hypothetical protein